MILQKFSHHTLSRILFGNIRANFLHTKMKRVFQEKNFRYEWVLRNNNSSQYIYRTTTHFYQWDQRNQRSLMPVLKDKRCCTMSVHPS